MTMSDTYNTNRQVPLGSVSIFRLTSAFEAAVRNLAAWRRARRTRQTLAGLSDEQLADIGVARHEISDVSGTRARF